VFKGTYNYNIVIGGFELKNNSRIKKNPREFNEEDLYYELAGDQCSGCPLRGICG
jgi:hypothetical protein